MTKNIKILSGILICIIVLFLISQSRQKRHITQTTGIFSILMDEVNKFDIQKDTLFISIQRMDTTWQIIGNDSLFHEKLYQNNIFFICNITCAA